jgi:hypothetical protein
LRNHRRSSILLSEEEMLTALRQKAVVQPGGVIQINAPELKPGTLTEVVVLVEAAERPLASMLDLLGAGRGSFASPSEVDQFLRRERESWRS